jgi:hypothetical protein
MWMGGWLNRGNSCVVCVSNDDGGNRVMVCVVALPRRTSCCACGSACQRQAPGWPCPGCVFLFVCDGSSCASDAGFGSGVS